MAPRCGYQPGYHHSSRAPASYSSRHQDEGRPDTRVQREAYNIDNNYESNTPHHFQRTLDTISLEQDMTIDFEVAESTIH
jgi:hypothetical protein